MNPSDAVRQAVMVGVLACAAFRPLSLPCQTLSPWSRAGTWQVRAEKNILLRDSRRQKNLLVSAYYPVRTDGTRGETAVRHPVIVFSHGAGGSGDAEFAIVSHWASHGYVVLCPTHDDSVKLQRSSGKVVGGVTELIARALTDRDLAVNRCFDISFVLDSLDALLAKLPGFSDSVDRGRVGVGGHSLGAYTAQVVAGATIQFPGDREPRSYADPRVKAVLQLSGQGSGQGGLFDRSWDNLRLPMMCVTGSLDRGAKGQPPEWRREPFDRSPPGDKYFLFIDGAHHGSFTGRADGALRFRAGEQAAIFEWVTAATTGFWDAYLKQDESARAFLKSSALSDASAGKARVEQR